MECVKVFEIGNETAFLSRNTQGELDILQLILYTLVTCMTVAVIWVYITVAKSTQMTVTVVQVTIIYVGNWRTCAMVTNIGCKIYSLTTFWF